MMLQNKVAVVTGASRGIGASIAKSFAEEGAIVVINYLHQKEQADLLVKEINQSGGQAISLQADVRILEDAQAMLSQTAQRFGSLDIIVNNALSPYSFNPKKRKAAWELEWIDYQEQIEGSVHGAFNICKTAMPFMKQQLSGRMINMVSNLVDFPVVPYHDYTTAKSALLGYTRNLATELGRFGITVNAIAPGLTESTDSSKGTQEDIRDAIIKLTPLHRLAVPQDIANVALFLASSLSSFVTGQCIKVDGGLVMA
jgi:3-oxoacyl-[acyl-carrier protein] reductase